jgi:CHAD domain-containing protein
MDELDERPIRVSAAGIRREHGELRPGEARPAEGDYRVVEKWMTPAEALRAVCAACVQHIEGNRVGALAGADPEYLHQMRVALRRLRTAFEVFACAVSEAAELAGEVRRRNRALGRARRGACSSRTRSGPRCPSARATHLRAPAGGVRGASAKAKGGRRALESQRYYGLMRALRSLSYGDAPRPAGAVRALPMRHAVAVIAAMYARARKRGRKLKRLGSKDLHRLRNSVRRLRYALLFLAPLLPEARVRPLAESVESLQETLGVINDCAVARELIEEACRRARGPRLRKARKLLAKRIAAARDVRREALRIQWEGFRAAERAWATAGGYASSLRISG